jgi:hypothetical protein
MCICEHEHGAAYRQQGPGTKESTREHKRGQPRDCRELCRAAPPASLSSCCPCPAATRYPSRRAACQNRPDPRSGWPRCFLQRGAQGSRQRVLDSRRLETARRLMRRLAQPPQHLSAACMHVSGLRWRHARPLRHGVGETHVGCGAGAVRPGPLLLGSETHVAAAQHAAGARVHARARR